MLKLNKMVQLEILVGEESKYILSVCHDCSCEEIHSIVFDGHVEGAPDHKNKRLFYGIYEIKRHSGKLIDTGFSFGEDVLIISSPPKNFYNG